MGAVMKSRSARTALRVLALVAFFLAGACTPSGPSPGTPAPAPDGVDGLVVINELPWFPFDTTEFVELMNVDDHAVDVGGWVLSDREEHAVTLAPARLEPGQLLTLVQDVDYDFGFKRTEGATLTDDDGDVVDTTDWRSDVVVFGLSWGRSPDGEGAFSVLPIATPGAPNAAPDPACPCCGPYCTALAQCDHIDVDGVSICGPSLPEHCAGSDLCAANGYCTLTASSCTAGSDADCQGSSSCAESANCTLLVSADGALGNACLPGKDADCRGSALCSSSARCSFEPTNGLCVTASALDCESSLFCTASGLCGFTGGNCRRVASTSAACSEPAGSDGYVPCAAAGQCTIVDGLCAATELADCLASAACTGRTDCALTNGICVGSDPCNCDGD